MKNIASWAAWIVGGLVIGAAVAAVIYFVLGVK